MPSPTKLSVLVTRPIFSQVVQRLEEHARVIVSEEDRCLETRELIERVRGMNALLSFVTDRVDAAVMDAAPGLRVIGNCAVGYDNIDLAAATERGIQVSNTPGVLTEATADLAWALLLAVARGLVPADRHVREGAFHGWGPMDFLGRDLCGTTLGILGMGRIGQAVARRAMGFRMRILYTTRSPWQGSLGSVSFPDSDFDPGPHPVPLDVLLRESDFLSIHVPLNPSTHRLIGRKELAMMKPSAVLINTSRGKVLDEGALVDVLRERKIAGAGLDVFEDEPALAPGLADLDNAVLLPHIGSASVGTRMKMAMTAAENIIQGLQGRRVPNLVNTDLPAP
jgi:lactate dehydrogenase-like 2-hydroxyacid dehydrogenase